MVAALAALFLLSGAAGLCYETVWARYLGLFLGHTAYAQVVVLVIFLGGMAVGALVCARHSRRLARPLLLYALTEALIGIGGLFFHEWYLGLTGWAYRSLFPSLAAPVLLEPARWMLAALLILPQSILLGASFPLLVAGALRLRPGRPGRIVALLYAVNSLGGAVGVLIAGFYLVAHVGLPGTAVAAGIANLVAAAGAVLLARLGPQAIAAFEAAPVASSLPPGPAPLLLAVAFGTAVASFFYEIAWIRMLALVLSSATHAFELMLSAFILGLGLGSLWLRRRIDRLENPLPVLGLVQCLMGLAALATLPLYLRSFDWMAAVVQGFAPTAAGYTGFTLARYGICLAVMLPATFCAGLTLPLLTRALLTGGLGEAALGRVYGLNTLGAIIGAGAGALLLLPLLGLKGLLLLGAVLDLALGAAILFAARWQSPAGRLPALAAAGTALCVAAFGAAAPGLDRDRLLSGVFRFGVLPQPGSRELLYYEDGRTATVSAQRIAATGERFIATNGKSDGALPDYWYLPCGEDRRPLRGDAATLSLSALITLAHRPEARTGAVVGQGTGMSSHLLLGSPALRELYTVEIEPGMVRASRRLGPVNHRVFDDPRSHLVIADARSWFAAGRRRFDFIFSEPSQPWVSGVSSLFTREFYQRVSVALAPGGVFAQWIHLYDIDDRLILTVLAAVDQTFGDYQVFMTAATDLVIVATPGPALPRPAWDVFQLPAVARDFCHQIQFTPAALEATRIGGRTLFRPLLRDYPAVNSDFFPYLDLGAEPARFRGAQAAGFYALSAEPLNLAATLGRTRTGPPDYRVAPLPGVPRVAQQALAATLAQPLTWLPGDTGLVDERLGAALLRQRTWDATLSAGEPPLNWRLWLQLEGEIERDRLGGSAGRTDPDLDRLVDRYLERHAAPRAVRAAIAFRRGLSGFDFQAAALASTPLIDAALARRGWIPADELRDGTVVAQLALRNPAAAREALVSLAPLSRRPPGDLRSALLAAWVASLEPGS